MRASRPPKTLDSIHPALGHVRAARSKDRPELQPPAGQRGQGRHVQVMDANAELFELTTVPTLGGKTDDLMLDRR